VSTPSAFISNNNGLLLLLNGLADSQPKVSVSLNRQPFSGLQSWNLKDVVHISIASPPKPHPPRYTNLHARPQKRHSYHRKFDNSINEMLLCTRVQHYELGGQINDDQQSDFCDTGSFTCNLASDERPRTNGRQHEALHIGPSVGEGLDCRPLIPPRRSRRQGR